MRILEGAGRMGKAPDLHVFGCYAHVYLTNIDLSLRCEKVMNNFN